MLMIAATMIMSCNPKDEDDNNNSGGNGNNGGGGIIGVYNPEKKISKIIHKMNYFYETEEMYEWAWGNNSLEITDSYLTLKYLFDEQHRLTSVENPHSGEYFYSYIYKGNKLVEVKYLNIYDNDDCRDLYRLEYSANKLSKVEWIDYPNDYPDYVYDIVWNGNNVSEIIGYDKEGVPANIHMSFEYDDKKNPFYGLLYLPGDIWAGEGTYDAIASISENNITRIVVDSNFEGQSYTNNYTYEYDKEGYPILVTVSEDNMYEIKYLSDNNNDDDIDNSDEDWWNVEVDKNVLLEKYTGVRCVNCPYANQLALELQEKYGDRLVILNVHAGPLSAPIGSFPDFTTDEGAEWSDSLGVVTVPIGFVNRKSNEGHDVYDLDNEIANVINEKSFINIIPTINYNNLTRDLSVEIKSQFDKELFGTFKLTVCIMEDDIVGAQYTPQGIDPEYVHHNVFRETMTEAWGDNLELSGEVVKSYSMTLNSDYNDDNCYIIAYVSDANTNEIIQVIKKKII